ncbi:hypothetical protein HMPREF3039_02248 [Akkermansia sp. KLE1798]|nr:hypothetical protein HMPREF3039_02248 [Akkermansia sp. KLE1798]
MRNDWDQTYCQVLYSFAPFLSTLFNGKNGPFISTILLSNKY